MKTQRQNKAKKRKNWGLRKENKFTFLWARLINPRINELYKEIKKLQ